MISGRKGQWGLILGLVIVTIAMTAGFYIWQGASSGAWPSDPEAYIKMWKGFADAAFRSENQPWRMIGLFVFPFLIYFSLIFFALNMAMIGVRQRFSYVYPGVERPLVILCFAIAFMQLPFPFTYSMYGWFASLSPILIIFAWILPIIGIALIFYAHRGNWPGGSSVPSAPPIIPNLPASPGGTPGLSAPVNQALQNAIIVLNNNSQRINNIT